MEKFSDFIGSIVAGTAIVGSIVIAYKVGRNVQFLADCREAYMEAEKEMMAEKQTTKNN